MKYKAVIFDLDGTLLDTLQDLTNSVNHTLTIHGYPKRSLTEIKSFVGNGIKALLLRALPYEIPVIEFDLLFSDFMEYYNNHSLDYTKPYEGILDLLKQLKTLGIKTAIISNKNHQTTKELKEQVFGNLIDIAFGTRDFTKTKPNPESTLEAMQILKVSQSESIFVGDSDVDILTAKNAGISCISVAWGFKDKEFLINHGATICLDTPNDLLKYL